MPELRNSTTDIFIKLVREMRCKQQAYFANRTQMTLIQAKAAEKTVDGWLNHFTELKFFESIPTQSPLLDQENKP
jgi:hypothetical protein